MIYIIYFIEIAFTALPTEVPYEFKVESRKVSREITTLNRDEAYQNFAKVKALAPYNNWTEVKLDSLIICKPDTKKSNKNNP